MQSNERRPQRARAARAGPLLARPDAHTPVLSALGSPGRGPPRRHHERRNAPRLPPAGPAHPAPPDAVARSAPAACGQKMELQDLPGVVASRGGGHGVALPMQRWRLGGWRRRRSWRCAARSALASLSPLTRPHPSCPPSPAAGTQAFVHVRCLRRWQAVAGKRQGDGALEGGEGRQWAGAHGAGIGGVAGRGRAAGDGGRTLLAPQSGGSSVPSACGAGR